jgi:hypothetical protein
MINLTGAIYQLYPQVTSTVGMIAYDNNGNEVLYDLTLVTEQAQKTECKQQASQLLYATDWTTIPDVANSANNPFLINQAEFIVYRNIIRNLAVNPVIDPVFPDVPTPAWSS